MDTKDKKVIRVIHQEFTGKMKDVPIIFKLQKNKILINKKFSGQDFNFDFFLESHKPL